MVSVWALPGPVIGCDPGASGAVAYLDPSRRLLLLWDMPVEARGARSRVSPIGLAAIRAALDLQPRPIRVVIEDVAAMPGQGVSGMFAFGFAAGAAETALAGLGPVQLVKPAAWKGALSLRAEKRHAVDTATAWLDGYGALFKGARGGGKDGRAEAALLAVYGALKARSAP